MEARPQVAELEHERQPPKRAHAVAGNGGEELRRGRDNDVGAGLEQCCRHTGRKEAEEVERSPHDASVRGDIGLDPNHADSVNRFRLMPAIAVPAYELSLWEVGCRGHHGNAVPPPYPVARAFMDATRRGIGFRWEVLGEKQYFHSKEPVTWATDDCIAPSISPQAPRSPPPTHPPVPAGPHSDGHAGTPRLQSDDFELAEV